VDTNRISHLTNSRPHFSAASRIVGNRPAAQALDMPTVASRSGEKQLRIRRVCRT
jgi:hypothetical protein